MSGYQHRPEVHAHTRVAHELMAWRQRAEVAEARAGRQDAQIAQAQRRADYYEKRARTATEKAQQVAAEEVNKATERVRTLEAEAAVHVREIQRLKHMYEPDGMPRRPADERLGRERLAAAAAEVDQYHQQGRAAA
ncbi:hypothetical protein [Citricoccus sp. K5]|uniref:hypothetical protein n=1 Tax=Citricoccus sp. K5 TaxID=2653135 RepID=UPI0012F28813|nr:hypothetical protein [Citricoccus sp. K5]VXA93295.1 hypothetical protein CITRIK5_100052 [Citricoccus sp. K5]VXA95969.1 hypothetical protein CITRIK5_100118 [Citricoccus sp. K5]